MGAVLWELLVGRRLFTGANEGEVLEQLLFADVAPPSTHVAGLPAALDDVVMRALARDPAARFDTASALARALESAIAPALPSQVAAWLEALVGETLRAQAARIDALGSHDAASTTAGAGIEAAAAERASLGRSDEEPRSGSAELPFDSTHTGYSAIEPRMQRTARLWPWLASAALASALFAGWMLLRTPSSTLPVTPLSEGAPADPRATTAPLPESAQVAPHAVTPLPAAPASASASTGPLRAAPASPPRPRAPKCEPYTIDKAGHKIYNLDCLP
jgi:serine/threonine-protein kinase